MEGDAETRFARTLQTDAITTCVCVCVCGVAASSLLLASLGDDVRLSCTQHSALDTDTCSPSATTRLTAAAAAAAAATQRGRNLHHQLQLRITTSDDRYQRT